MAAIASQIHIQADDWQEHDAPADGKWAGLFGFTIKAYLQEILTTKWAINGSHTFTITVQGGYVTVGLLALFEMVQYVVK